MFDYITFPRLWYVLRKVVLQARDVDGERIWEPETVLQVAQIVNIIIIIIDKLSLNFVEILSKTYLVCVAEPKLSLENYWSNLWGGAFFEDDTN